MGTTRTESTSASASVSGIAIVPCLEVGASVSDSVFPILNSGSLDREDGVAVSPSPLLSERASVSERASLAPLPPACSGSGKITPGVIVDGGAPSAVSTASSASTSFSVLDGMLPSADSFVPRPDLSHDSLRPTLGLPDFGGAVKGCSSACSMSLPCSSLPPSAELDYPVFSSLPAGSLPGPDVFSGAPSVAVTSLLQPSSNFNLKAQNFPPLSPSKSSAAPISVPPCQLPLRHPPTGSAARPSWASLVQDTPAKLLLSYAKPISSSAVAGRLRVKLPSDVAEKGASVWKNTLVGFSLDNLPYSFVQASAHRLWINHGLSEVLSNGNGFFFFKFSDSAGLNAVLEGGPWHFGGKPIFIKLWNPGMNLSKEGCKRVPIWAKFYNVPLELWTVDGLSFIASAVGKPLHADRITASFKRLNYARICIEINIDDSLPNAIDIDLDEGCSLEIQIEYNWIPKKCSVCSEFGHLSKDCKRVSRRIWVPKTSIPPVISSSPGVWKNVTDHGRAKMNMASPVSKAQHLPTCVLPHGVSSASGLNCSINAFDSLHGADDAGDPNILCSSILDSSAGILGRFPQAVPSSIGPLSVPSAESAASIDCRSLPNVSGISPPSSPPSCDDVMMNWGLKPDSGIRDPIGPGFGDPIAAGDPIGSGADDPFISHDPIGAGVVDPLAADDPFGSGVDDPIAFDDPFVPKAISSVSSAPMAISSVSSVPMAISSEDQGVLSPSDSVSSLLARRILMVDEFEKKLGRKQKDKRKSGGCGSSGISRGKPSPLSK